MSRWCSECAYKKYRPCNRTCIVFGKDFDELAELVIQFQEEIVSLQNTLKIESTSAIRCLEKINEALNAEGEINRYETR